MKLGLLNSTLPTRLPSNLQPTSPDVSLISAHLSPSVLWSVPSPSPSGQFSSDPVNSDHLPILINFLDPQRRFNLNHVRANRSFTNFRRANWQGFRTDLGSYLPAAPPTSCSHGEKVLRKAILKASGRNIPSGISGSFTPNLPPEAAPLIRERDQLWAYNPFDPQIAVLQSRIRDVCNAASRDAFQKEVGESE